MTTPASSSSTLAVVSLQHSVQTKHTQTNYLVWKLQVTPYLVGYDIFCYVDGSIPPPTTTFTGSSSNLVPNPAFHQWRKQDQMILSVLISSLRVNTHSSSMPIHFSGSLGSLRENVKGQSQGRIMHLRVQLTTFKKESFYCRLFSKDERICKYLGY
jgi:hypothetical protein